MTNTRLHEFEIQAKVHRMELFAWEEKFKRTGLEKRKGVSGNLGDMVTRYLCWRRAVLQAAGFFWMISLTVSAWKLVESVQSSYSGQHNGTTFGLELGDYAPHFQAYIAIEYTVRVLILLSGYCAVFFSFVAAYVWRKFKASRPPAFISYMLGYSVPFMVYLLLPNRSSVDIEGIQQHVCRDMVSGRYKLAVSGD